jgi:UDP-N-acetylmuramoyl-L-alanyl-D-glutamate--2,6-diaminopimelate ligase
MSTVQTLIEKILPSHVPADLELIGVTGTSGKTIVASTIHHLLHAGGLSVGLISTLGVFAGKEKLDREWQDFTVNLTRPGILDRALKKLHKLGMQYVVVELPVNLLEDGAVKNKEFTAMVVTNIYKDLDVYSQFGDYPEYAKYIFSAIRKIKNEGLVVLNADDDSAGWLADQAKSIEQNIYAAWISQFMATEVEQILGGMRFKFNGGIYATRNFTNLGLMNTMQALQIAAKFVGTNVLDAGLNTFPGVPGRFDTFDMQGRTVIVDYPYLESSIGRALAALKPLVPAGKRLIVVFGAAGERGPQRYRLVLPVSKHADLMLLCAQDPRRDHVANINSAMIELVELQGAAVVDRFTSHDEYSAVDKKNLQLKINRVIENGDKPLLAFDASSPSSRYDAVDFALRSAEIGDVILLLGKGDDEVIDFGDALYEWNDHEMIVEIAATIDHGAPASNFNQID